MKGDTILILALVLSILLVFVYTGASISNWFSTPEEFDEFKENVSEEFDEFKEKVSNNINKIESGIGQIFSIGEKQADFGSNNSILKQMYSCDEFIFTSTDAAQRYYAQLTWSNESTRDYGVYLLQNSDKKECDIVIISDGIIETINSYSRDISSKKLPIFNPEFRVIYLSSTSYEAKLSVYLIEKEIAYAMSITKK
jgi:hypothetical protein